MIFVPDLSPMIRGRSTEQISVVCAEECAELIHAVMKPIRTDNTMVNKAEMRRNLIEEIADVTICIHEMLDIYGIEEDEIEEMITYKYERWLQRNNGEDMR